MTRDQASRLLALPDPGTLKGKRDLAMLGLLLGCGLRRDELVRLTVEEIQLGKDSAGEPSRAPLGEGLDR